MGVDCTMVQALNAILRVAVTTGSAAAFVTRMVAVGDGDPERFLSFLLLLSSLMICLLYRYDLLVYSPDSVLNKT